MGNSPGKSHCPCQCTWVHVVKPQCWSQCPCQEQGQRGHIPFKCQTKKMVVPNSVTEVFVHRSVCPQYHGIKALQIALSYPMKEWSNSSHKYWLNNRILSGTMKNTCKTIVLGTYNYLYVIRISHKCIVNTTQRRNLWIEEVLMFQLQCYALIKPE